MAELQRVLDYIVGFKTDQSSINKTNKAIGSVEKEMRKLDSTQSQVSSTAKQVNDEMARIAKRRNDLKRIADAYKSVAVSVEDTGVATAKAAKLLQRMGATGDDIAFVRKELGASSNEAQALAIALDKAQQNALELSAVRYKRASDAGEQLGNFDTGLSTIAGLGVGGGALRSLADVSAAGEALVRLKASAQGLPATLSAVIAELGPGGLAAGAGLSAALVGLSLVLKATGKAAEDARKRAADFVSIQLDVNDVIVRGSAAVEEEIAQNDLLITSRENGIARIKGEQAANEQLANAYEDTTNRILYLVDRLTGIDFGKLDSALDLGVIQSVGERLPFIGDNIAEFAEFGSQIEDISTTTDNLRQSNELLGDSLEDGTAAAFDAANAERELARAREDNRTGFIQAELSFAEKQAEAQVEINRLIAESDKETAQERIDSYNEQLAIARATFDEQTKLLSSSNLNDEQERLILDRRAIAEQEIIDYQRLISVYEDALPAINDATNALEKFADASIGASRGSSSLFDLINDIQASTTNATKYNQDIADIEQKGADKIAGIRQSLADKEAGFLQGLSDSLGDARIKAHQALEDLEYEQTSKLLKIEEDYAAERIKINKKASRDINRAVEDRDALAFTRARQDRDDQLDEAKAGYDEQRKELQRSYQQQLRDISISLDRQEQELRTKYQRQLRAAQQAASQQISLEQQRLSAELRTRQQAYQSMLSLEQSFAQSSINLMQGMASAAAGIQSQLLSQATQQAQQIASSGISGALNILGGGSSPSYVTSSSNRTITQNNSFSNISDPEAAASIAFKKLASLF